MIFASVPPPSRHTGTGADASTPAEMSAGRGDASGSSRAHVFLIIVVALTCLGAIISPGSTKATSELMCISSGTVATNTQHLSGTSGHVFSGSRVRKLPTGKTAKFSYWEPQPRTVHENLFSEVGSEKCERWSVVTTIFEPSQAINETAHLDGWCLVIIGDTKTPEKTYARIVTAGTSRGGTVVFLGVAMQKRIALKCELVAGLPWAHFSRKNIGYLFAIAHGARIVWDFDDGNILLPHSRPPLGGLSDSSAVSARLLAPANEVHSFNPYPMMGAPHSPSWPRGFPLEVSHVMLPTRTR